MAGILTGGCQCGSLRYEIKSAGKLAACHCRGCQRQSGSAFGLSLGVASSGFELLTGELRSFSVECDSGRTKECAFCPACGTRIYHEGESGLSVKAGTLDETRELEPDAHYWTREKQRWLTLPTSVPTFEDDG